MKLLFPTKEDVDKIRQLQEEIASLTGEKAEDFKSAVESAFKEVFGTEIKKANDDFVHDWVGFVLCKTMLNS